MIRRHEDELMNRFDALYANGWTQFTRDELLLWYGLVRMTKTVYADLNDRWERTLDSYAKEAEDVSVIVKGETFLLFRQSLAVDLSDL